MCFYLIDNGTMSSSASTSSSRNNSPRPLIEAKLRPGAGHRNLSHLQQRNSVNYTNSTLQEDLMKLINPDYNMTSSDDNFHNGALQSIKAQKTAQNSHSLGNISVLNNGLKSMNITTTDDIILMRKKSRSREGINLGSHSVPINTDLKIKNTIENSELIQKSNGQSMSNGTNGTKQSKVNDSDIILTTARPATIISSATQLSPTKEENILHIHEENSPPRRNVQVTNTNMNGNNKQIISNGGQATRKVSSIDYFVPPRSLPLLPDTKDVDWSSLVDNAITQINEGLKKHYYESGGVPPVSIINSNNGTTNERQHGNNSPSYESLSSTSSTSSTSSGLPNRLNQPHFPDLQNQVTQLEDRISKETRRRKSLEHAVRRLTDENRRLQDESQAAVQQLRRFSEWFFQTIDRQT